MSKNIVVSALGKTWILDIDGTVCKHNGYKLDGHDTLLPGAKQFFEGIDEIDKVVFITSRSQAYAEMTESFLRENGIRWNAIIYDLPYGERSMVNDKKPSGLKPSIAVNTERDVFIEEIFIVDESL